MWLDDHGKAVFVLSVSICANASRNSIVTIGDGGIRAEKSNLSVFGGYGDEFCLM